jgi:peptidoglycan/LPS O-acetylase OafA/YrhL
MQSHLWYYDQNLPWYYIAGYVLFISNWVYAIFGAPQSICAPLWTVSIEEQFYLIWPMLAKFLRRRGMLIAGTAMFLLATLTQVGLVLSGAKNSYIYFGSASRCDSLALGIILALCIDHLPKLTRGVRWLLVGSGLAGYLFSAAWLTNNPDPVDMRIVWGRLIISLASGVILYGCLYSCNKLLRAGWIVRLGKVSYGLYMLHFTGLLITLSLFRPGHGWALLAAKTLALAVTVLLAFASYHWVESPFLRLKSRFATVQSRPL